MFQTAHRVGKVIEREYHATSLTIACQDGPHAGQTVPHVHVHIIPRRLGDYIDNDEIYADITRHTHDLCTVSTRSSPAPYSALDETASPEMPSSSAQWDTLSNSSAPELMLPLDSRMPGDDSSSTEDDIPSRPSSRARDNEGLIEEAEATVNHRSPPRSPQLPPLPPPLTVLAPSPQHHQEHHHHRHHHHQKHHQHHHHVNVSALPVAKKGVDNEDRRARTAEEMAEEASRLALLFTQD
ncbi:hypothetical protein BGZ73_003828 [Actinomortierella ambigua]|nr:hypothetical protein BGZ73_003828 [Actinomortierella ambigua]